MHAFINGKIFCNRDPEELKRPESAAELYNCVYNLTEDVDLKAGQNRAELFTLTPAKGVSMRTLNNG